MSRRSPCFAPNPRLRIRLDARRFTDLLRLFHALPLSLLALLLISCSPKAPAGPRPNLVLVTFDTLRADYLGAAFAGSNATPNLDEFARNARVFGAAFTTIPTTAPAHASLFTGLHPYEHGVMANGMRLSPELARSRSLPSKLRSAGYATAAFATTTAFGPELMGLEGFGTLDMPRVLTRPGNGAVRAALRWLKEVEGQPVFLWVHLYAPHSPYGTQAEKEGNYPVDFARYGWVDRARYRDASDREQMSELYLHGVQESDVSFGKLVTGVRRLLEPDPIIIATSDHGEYLAEILDAAGFAYGHGAILGDEVLRIPLLISGPGIDPGVDPGAASIRDLYTTLLEIAGVGDPDAEKEGRLDLRLPISQDRLVSAELRHFQLSKGSQRQIGAAGVEHIRGNAVAVMDGNNMIVLGETGELRVGSDSHDPKLASAARARLTARKTLLGTSLETGIDEEIRRNLKNLGYLR